MKKYNFKLIFACVFLAASLTLFALGKFGKILMMFACFCLSASFVLFALDRRDKDEKELKEMQEEYESLKLSDEERKSYIKYEKKTKNSITRVQIGLFTGAVLLIITGIIVMF